MNTDTKVKIVEGLIKIKLALGEHVRLIEDFNKTIKEPDGNFMDFQTVKEGFDGVEEIQTIIRNLK